MLTVTACDDQLGWLLFEASIDSRALTTDSVAHFEHDGAWADLSDIGSAP